MEEYVVEEIIRDLKWHERIVVKVFKKIFVKIYRMGMIKCFNFYNE